MGSYKVTYNYLNFITKIELFGLINVTNVVQLAQELFNQKYSERTLYLTDTTKANFDWEMEDVKNLHERLAPYIRKEKNIYEALLIDDPQKHALATIFQFDQATDHHRIEIFIQEDSAIKWLQNFRQI